MNWQGSKRCSKRIGAGLPAPVRFCFLARSGGAARVPAESAVTRGDQVCLSAQAGRLHFFDPDTELPISK